MEKKISFFRVEFLFFSMATRSKNKNGGGILEAVRNNPQQTFVIAGRSYEPESGRLHPNVHVLGYISDGDACSLMKNCKAFICPSFYEEFGVPPQEALVLGADVIVSNTSALPEFFGDSAHYVDPYNANVDLEALLHEHVAPADKTLEKYSWETSAKRLYELLCLEPAFLHGDFGAISVKDLFGNEEKADLYCQRIECERIEIAADTANCVSFALRNAVDWRMRESIMLKKRKIY